MNHQEWIKENYPTDKSAYGKCHEACEKMIKKFPELTMVKGWYFEPIWNQDREHWWLKDSNNKIIDPTAIQFPTKGSSYYKEFREGIDKVPTGKCMNCGEYCYDGRKTSCCPECDKILNDYYNNI